MPTLTPLPAFTDNYIWALQGPDGAVVVDPGDAAPVQAVGLQPAAVLITHHHLDHCGGITALRSHWPNLPVYAPHDGQIAGATLRVAGGDQIEIAGMTFEVIAVPGHTLGHVAYRRLASDGELFCGDTLFSLGCGRLFEGTSDQMLASLDRLAALPDRTRVCCGHEYTLSNAAFALTVDSANTALLARIEQIRAQRARNLPSLPSTIASEKACNPFLRVRTPAVRQAIAAYTGMPAGTPAQTLANLRRWKDTFVA